MVSDKTVLESGGSAGCGKRRDRGGQRVLSFSFYGSSKSSPNNKHVPYLSGVRANLKGMMEYYPDDFTARFAE